MCNFSEPEIRVYLLEIRQDVKEAVRKANVAERLLASHWGNI